MPRHLPLTNKKNPVDLTDIQLVIFAGGLGKRLGPGSPPKPLLPACGTPLIDLQIQYGLQAGFRKFTIFTGYAADEVEKHVLQAFPELERHFVFVRHEWNPLTRPYGTGRALYHAIRTHQLNENKPILTLFVDDLFARVDYVYDLVRTYYKNLGKGNTLAIILTHPGVFLPYGVVSNRHGVFTEKPYLDYHVSTGMYLLTPLFLKKLMETISIEMYMNLPEEISFEKFVLEPWSRKYHVIRVDTVKGEWLPINDWKNAEQVCRFLDICDWITMH
jgi:NDP-sugar pyrophosphorylase family protein